MFILFNQIMEVRVGYEIKYFYAITATGTLNINFKIQPFLWVYIYFFK